MSEISALIIGYLLGSIPTAYLVTRFATGRDIRSLGGGNVGGLNTFREVGIKAGVVVALVDFGKGAASVAIAYWLLDLSPLFVMLAGLAAAIGHMWMVFLKFNGGKGMGPTWGALAVLLPIYGYWYGFFIFLTVAAVPFAITRNVALSMGVVTLALPFIVWLLTSSGWAVVISSVLGVLIAVKFLPTALTAWVKNKNARDFIFDNGRQRR